MIKKAILLAIIFSFQLNAHALTVSNITHKLFYLKAFNKEGVQCTLDKQYALPVPAGKRVGNLEIGPEDCKIPTRKYVFDPTEGIELECAPGFTSYTITQDRTNKYHCMRRS